MTEIINQNNNQITCKYCQSENTIKKGLYKGVQRYWCKECKRKFKADDRLFKMKLPADQVSRALNSHYEGLSIRSICRQIKEETGSEPSTNAVYGWIEKYTDVAVNSIKDYHPKVGDTWICDETFVRVDKSKANVENPYSKSRKAKWVVFWDVIDADTRYLLASYLTTTRGTKDAQALMEKAAKVAGKVPKVVVTDNLAAYLDGVELAFGADTEHRKGGPFDIQNNSNLIERFHGTLKARTKVMRALKNRDTLEKFTDGWLVHYNFLRPHESLDGKTPAQAAGLNYPCKNWTDITHAAHPQVRVLVKPAKVSIVEPVELPEYKPTRISRKIPRITATTPRLR